MALALTAILILGNMSYVMAEVETTTESHAKVLKAIQVLRGTGSGFNLDGYLKRSEGATFIVRLLGKEKEVLANKEKYGHTSFTDVKDDAWFVPYVSYCVDAGIINGYPDQTFRPNEVLSERAFVKMVLSAMGYEINKAYTWKRTFEFAYRAKVLEDASYLKKEDNNNNYKRGEVVNLLYRVIGMNNAAGEEKMAEKLVQGKLMSREQAKAYRFIVDTVDMEVEEFSQIDATTFLVRFNEKPVGLNVSNFLISEKGKTAAWTIRKIVFTELDRLVYIKMGEQKSDTNYTLTLTKIIDSEGNRMKDKVYEFTNFRQAGYTSNYYRVSQVISKDLSSLEVRMTQPVDTGKIQPKDFALLRDGNVVMVGSKETLAFRKDAIDPYLFHVDLLTTNLKADKAYDLQVSGEIRSTYGCFLKEGQGELVKFQSAKKVEATFKLETVALQSANKLQLTFNKSINTSVAEQIYSYYLTTQQGQPIEILEAKIAGSNKQVILKTSKVLTEGETYHLTLNQVYETNRKASILDKVIVFKAEITKKAELSIASMTVTAADRIEIVVDQYLDETEVLKVSNYRVKGVTDKGYHGIPTSITYDLEAVQPAIILHLQGANQLVDGDEYEVSILSDMKTAKGVELIRSVKKNGMASKGTYKKEGLSQAIYIGNRTVKIRGSRGLTLEVPNVLNTNYRLIKSVDQQVEMIKPIGVTYINPYTLLLKFEALDTEATYQLLAKELILINGKKINGEEMKIDVEISTFK